MCKISIITVVYNSSDKIISTFYSVVVQSYKSYEVLVIDGKSTDNTLDIVKTYENKVSNLRVYSEPDKGIYDAMNKGVKLAKGEYVYFLNAGDLLYDKDVLANVAKQLDGENLVYGNAISKNESGKLIPYRVGVFSKYRLAHTNICHQTIFYPREALLAHPFNLRYRLFADWDVNMQLWKRVKFCYIDQNVVLYEGGGASDVQKDLAFKNDQLKLITKYLGVDAIGYLILRKLNIWK